MSNLIKKMLSFSKLPAMIILCITSLVVLLFYLFFGKASSSVDKKLNDMIKYSNQYRSAFLNRTNLLYLYVDSSNIDYYSDYMNENIKTGDMTYAKNMLLAIGLEENEKEIITKIDNAWDKYLAPVEQKALNKMIQKADKQKARKYISGNEYVSCVKYISNSQKTLGDSIESRLLKEKKAYIIWRTIFLIILILNILGIALLSYISSQKIKRLGIMIENERESLREISIKNDVLKRRKMRNSKRRR